MLQYEWEPLPFNDRVKARNLLDKNAGSTWHKAWERVYIRGHTCSTQAAPAGSPAEGVEATQMWNLYHTKESLVRFPIRFQLVQLVLSCARSFSFGRSFETFQLEKCADLVDKLQIHKKKTS